MNSSRIKMEGETGGDLKAMTEQLKTEYGFIKITSAELASWIIKRFREKYLDLEKRNIAKDFFSAKGYLKTVMGQLDESKGIQDVIKLLREDLILPGKVKGKESGNID